MATSRVSGDFAFPPIYSFPPFFTIQPNLSTKNSQLRSWSQIVQSYCRHHRIFVLNLVDSVDTPLFWNKALSRRLGIREAKEVLEFMVRDGRAEAVGETSSKGKGKDNGRDTGEEGGKYWIYWKRPEEWASVVEEWVDATGQKNTVLTLYELLESDATASQEFHKMDPILLQKSLQTLVKRGKAQIFGSEDSLGIKFF